MQSRESRSSFKDSRSSRKINTSDSDLSIDQTEPRRKKVSRSAKKLKQKGLSLRTDFKDTNLAKRYYHICVDKLADAFEKQFMLGIPDFSLYTKNDL